MRFNNNSNTEAAVITHGGYTPYSGFISSGSGKTTVPNGITVNLYAPADTVCVGTNAYWKVSTGVCSNPVAETLNPMDITENYSLTHDEKLDSWNFDDKWKIDIILVKKNKAHLKDVWKLIKTHKLPYHTLHCFFCRINKASYSDEVG